MKRLHLFLLFCFISFLSIESIETRKRPRLTVVMVIDQFAYHYIPKLSPFLRHGLKFLLKQGVVYENAYYPHAMPSTGPGHTGLNTAVDPKDHGIIANSWCTSTGCKVACDDDSVEDAAVINPDGGLYDYGKGPANIMVDGITDQFIMSSGPCNIKDSYSISLKSRAAIGTAGRMGKALWFDDETGKFTSSLAYFDQLPQWLINFNAEQRIGQLKSVYWNLAYPCKKLPYCFKHIHNYEFSTRKYSLIGKPLPIDWQEDNPFELFKRTPRANQLIFDCALRCIETHMNRKSCNELIVWVCLSPLDMVGHDYGPDSLEAIDMVYHLDCQIKRFMNCITSHLKRTEVLFALTADHGVCPIPELLNEDGFSLAKRIQYKEVAEILNKRLKKDVDIGDLVANCQSAQLWLDEERLHELPKDQQKKIVRSLRSELLKYPGIKRVWTYQELENSWFAHDQLESYFKNQMYPGRTGHLIIQTNPYCPPQDLKKGTSHRTPYEYDTHVPLILYQKGNVEKRVLHEKVWALQFAPSLAYLLNIPKPSASTYTMLPGLVDYDPITGEALQTVVI